MGKCSESPWGTRGWGFPCGRDIGDGGKEGVLNEGLLPSHGHCGLLVDEFLVERDTETV